MVDAMRAMLDELMGKERDLRPEERTGRGITYKDDSICKFALAGLCPFNGLFQNTKSALGPCKYEVHEDDPDFAPAKAEWDALPEEKRERYGYRRELLELLRQLVRDMDRKVERNRERAAKESAARLPTASEQAQLDDLQAREKAALRQSEEAAERGDIDASMAFTTQAEGLKRRHAELLKEATTPVRAMAVCEVCGAYTNADDNEKRKSDHLAGKQYLGWLAIREKLAQLQAEDGARAVEPERDRRRKREEQRGTGRREEHRSSSRHERRHSERDRDRDSRRRSRSRERRRGAEVPPPGGGYSRGGERRERDQSYR